MPKPNTVEPLARSAYVDEVNQWVVPAKVVRPTQSGVASVGQILLITLPAHSVKEQMGDDVVHIEGRGGVVVGGHALSGHQPHQGRKRTVHIGIILSS